MNQSRPAPAPAARVVLSTLVSFAPIWATAALPVAEIGLAAFLATGLTFTAVGAWAPWIMVAACLLGAAVRAADIEAWALLVPGGAVGCTRQAFGARMAHIAAILQVGERVLFTALATLIIGSYAANAPFVAAAVAPLTRRLTTLDASALLATVIVASFWIRSRLGLGLGQRVRVGLIWLACTAMVVVIVWGIATPATQVHWWWPVMAEATATGGRRFTWNAFVSALAGLAIALPVIGGSDSLSRRANRLPLPRLPRLRRIGRLALIASLLLAAGPAFLLAKLLPSGALSAWSDQPWLGLVHHLGGTPWLQVVLGGLVTGAAALLLGSAAHAAMAIADQALRRLAVEHVVPATLGEVHPRFGTPARAIDVTAMTTVLVLVASAGRLSWLAQTYTTVLGLAILLNLAALIRLRWQRGATRTFRVPVNLRWSGRDVPIGLCIMGATIAAATAALVVRSLPASLAPIGLITGLVVMVSRPWQSHATGAASESSPADLLPAGDLSLEHVHARPGGVLVPVRNPHGLAHLAQALRQAGSKDVVVLAVRVLGVDAADSDADLETRLTRDEQVLFAAAIAVAEQEGQTVELLAVPHQNVFDAVTATAIRLSSSEVHVGESASLTAEAQARLLGDAWERASRPPDLAVRLVIHHRSGRQDVYHLGAHPPSLTAVDLNLIHRLWLDASKSVGSHVHHDDIVRAALIHMDQQLNGPEREQALALLRQVARPGDELAAAVRDRDFARLRDIARNRHASDLAELLTELSAEDQVVSFRVLPRRLAAEVFEYLSLESQEALVKGLAQDDVAALLNDMAPDDRTRFLEELPAAATRQLLALLTPAERSVAQALLGYPADSVGRLMTPHYVAVRESWTVQQVLDYIRQHGQDSETLNVIYVVDEPGVLVDDIRTREILLTSPDQRIGDLMDRRFVALKATDDQKTAVAAFRQYDRTALPVTDTTGVLIGIVTVDDVLDVAEAAATKDMQRIGGSEALDEPYTEIAFGRMIRKRAGWLTALFLGEMLTATAMTAFEGEIDKAVVLALFVPLIISSGGNSGSQASTLIVRAMSLGELRIRDWWMVMQREFFAGLTLGAILGTIGFLRITIWSTFAPDLYGPHWLLVAITVSLSLVGVVLWGSLIGSLLPLVLRRLGFDPAVSSAPFVATLVDVTGLVIYFSVAMVILRGTLL